MMDAASEKPPRFDVVLVHSFSRFFRDQFQLEFYVRKLAKSDIRLVSISQNLGDDPMSNMIRQMMGRVCLNLSDRVSWRHDTDPCV